MKTDIFFFSISHFETFIFHPRTNLGEYNSILSMRDLRIFLFSVLLIKYKIQKVQMNHCTVERLQ